MTLIDAKGEGERCEEFPRHVLSGGVYVEVKLANGEHRYGSVRCCLAKFLLLVGDSSPLAFADVDSVKVPGWIRVLEK